MKQKIIARLAKTLDVELLFSFFAVLVFGAFAIFFEFLDFNVVKYDF
ncbi:hypothetical protein [Parapedobacter koreensis]|nr:hypothetical protein [Parapedobacter koreensis]